MTMSRRLSWLVALLVAAALMLTLLPATPADAGAEHTYRVTITNLTDGQPLTPFVVATHTRRGRIFRPWRPASPGLQSLAENGGVPDLVAELTGNPRFDDVQVAGSAPFGSGESVSVEVVSTPGNRFLSVAGMLICTNDGFGAVSRRHLNSRHTRTFYGFGWDAGTEINTENYEDLVPPCDGLGETGETNPDLAQNGRIRFHRGIKGVGDLQPHVHGWHWSGDQGCRRTARLAKFNQTRKGRHIAVPFYVQCQCLVVRLTNDRHVSLAPFVRHTTRSRSLQRPVSLWRHLPRCHCHLLRCRPCPLDRSPSPGQQHMSWTPDHCRSTTGPARR